MEFWIYFWVYTFCMIVIWWFFIIAKIHSLKFKSYQPKIIKITSSINLVMIILTILWYISVFMKFWWTNDYTLEQPQRSDSKIENEISNFDNISTQKEIIGEDVWEDYY